MKKYSIAQPTFLGNEKRYLTDAIDSGWISSIGSYIETFEKEFAAIHGVKHAIATHNGTIALHLALAAYGIKEQDEVIVPDLTFVATANAVRYCNAKPVLTEIDPGTWNIDPDHIRKQITPRTRAIIPVHLYGNPAPMEEIMDLAKEYHLFVIEDCAEAPGAKIGNKLIGTYGDISCFSFFGNKIMTTGEGGMCLTNHDELAEKMRILRDHGMNRDKKYWYDQVGFNYRMTNMQAAVGLAQLEQLDKLLSLRDNIFNMYMEKVKNHPRLIFQNYGKNRHVNWIFTLRIGGINEIQRDEIIARLKSDGIDTRPVFYPLHQMPFYRENSLTDREFTNSVTVAREGISLPTYIGLNEDDITWITHHLLSVIDKIPV